MRAVVLRGNHLDVRETPDPVPREGELLLRTVSTAICASDIHYMDHPNPDAPGSFGELFVVSEALARAVPDDADADAVALVELP